VQQWEKDALGGPFGGAEGRSDALARLESGPLGAPREWRPLDVSLAIPCYNEEGHLEASVDALIEVMDATRYRYEILFVDDGSKDGTRELLKKICAARPQCRYLFHAKNKGRGGAFKTGFANTSGRVTGYLDIDLEVHARYVPSLVALIDQHGHDVATGYRHYLLSQTGGITRHFLSIGYRWLCRRLLGLGVDDSETGCKFFKRDSAAAVVMGSESDGWFWDTEVMSRAALGGLKIVESPVLFLRNLEKQSTVRLVRDIKAYLVELYAFRKKVGLSLGRSPIYWSSSLYDAAMRALYGRDYGRTYESVAKLIPDGASVVDVCAGTSQLYLGHLKQRGCDYLALDYNGHFVMGARNRGVNARLFDVLRDEVPEADYVVMTSSFYHFEKRAPEVLRKLRAAARKAVIVSEPVRNLSGHWLKPLAGVANLLTHPGHGDFRHRYDLEGFRALARCQGAHQFVHEGDARNAIAIFPPLWTEQPRVTAALAG
jgi:glycosyltransferase involved in cell wall biosynthesis